jgi:hypothetical protein
MKFRDFYNTLYKYSEEENIVNYYRIRVALVSGLIVYEGAIGNIPLKTFKLLSVFNVENTKIYTKAKMFVIYVN